MRRNLVLAAALVVVLVACTGKPLASGSPGATPLPSLAPSIAGGPPRVTGRVTAGPVCPVERIPPDPNCAPRPVAGAVIVATNTAGEEVGRTTSASDGTYWLAVGQTGTVTITAQPVVGLMGRPAPVEVTFGGPSEVQHLDLSYDTGIR